MEENPSKTPSKNEPRRHHREPHAGEDGQPKCSGKSCTAGVIADCVALCCCPCALVNLLTLAFVKVPYMIGKKCLIKRKKKKKKVNVMESQMSEEMEWVGNESSSSSGSNNWSGRFEEEKIWLELYQIGHLGFGRLSFTELQSLGKDN